MASVNKVILVGRLTRDPESRFLSNGDAVTNCSLATSEIYKDKQGQKVESTEFHNLVFFRKQAEIVSEYLKKGREIYVEGKIKTEKYTDKNGVEKQAIKIHCTEMRMIGSRTDQKQQANDSGSDNDLIPF